MKILTVLIQVSAFSVLANNDDESKKNTLSSKDFSKIIATEENDVGKLFFASALEKEDKSYIFDAIEKKREQNPNESFTSVVCDANEKMTGGQRKAELIANGINKRSITTILNTESKSCYTVFATKREFDMLPNKYAVMTLTHSTKMRKNTLNFLTDVDRKSPIIIETLLFQSDSQFYFDPVLSTNFEEKVLSFTRTEVLEQGSGVSPSNERPQKKSLPTLGATPRMPTSEIPAASNASNDLVEICDNAYNYLVFSFSDTSESNNLGKMRIDSSNMKEYMLASYNSIKLYQDCMIALVLSTSLLSEVTSIEVKPEKELFNAHIQYLVQNFTTKRYPWYEVGLDGTGEVIAASDTGIDLNNCYFWDSLTPLEGSQVDMRQRKVVQYIPFADDIEFDQGHGTHVVGTIAGRRSVDGQQETRGRADGVAYNSKLAFMDIVIKNESFASPTVDEIMATGSPYAVIHSASWGVPWIFYDEETAEIDAYLYDNDEYIFVNAGGNSGAFNAFGTVGSPGVGKNVITVGASESTGSDIDKAMMGPHYVADFSSKGPTTDGRIKPDIIAPGYWVLSANAIVKEVGECDPSGGVLPPPSMDGREGIDGIRMEAGTSMAAPAVAGVVGLIRQYFREGFYPTGVKTEGDAYPNPSGALVKAVLLNGAIEMHGVDNQGGITQDRLPPMFPSIVYDNIQGFGFVSLTNSLYIKDKSNIMALVMDRITIAERVEMSFPIKVAYNDWCNADYISVTLTWYDMAATPYCDDSCIMNDLDLYLTKESESQTDFKYYPNGSQGKDPRNTVERVRIHGVEDGDLFHVHVYGANFESLEKHQKFALVATGCIIDPENMGISSWKSSLGADGRKRATSGQL